jgi:outer membrane lipoprotein carrier protein
MGSPFPWLYARFANPRPRPTVEASGTSPRNTTMIKFACAFALGILCFGGPGSTGPSTQQIAEIMTAGQPAWRPDKASEVLTLVQAFYDGTNDLDAKFKQTYWNPSFGSRTKTGGKLKLKKPGQMVWDYDGTESDYYANGTELLMVEHDTRQVIRTEVGGNAEVTAAMKFLFGGQKLVRDFKVRYAAPEKTEKYGDADHYVLELKPKQASKHYKGLLIKVHTTTGRVDEFVVYNQDGSSNHFELQSVRTNTGIGDKVFLFKVPKGYVESRE